MPVTQSTEVKRCNKCRRLRPSADFAPERRNTDGLQGNCRPCNYAIRDRIVAERAIIVPERKTCSGCDSSKPIEEFGPDRRSLDGRQSRCYGCCSIDKRRAAGAEGGRERIAVVERRSKYKYRYGLTDEAYAAMLEAQGGVCAVCGRPPSGGPKSKNLVVDHCHTSKAVRGLTCQRCNVGIGYLGDSAAGLMRAVEYLKRHEGRDG